MHSSTSSVLSTRLVIGGLLVTGLCVNTAQAQVTSADPNYSVSLLASGLQLPDGGVVYRPATNDLLVTQEDLGIIVSVNATTGVVTPFANLTSYSISNHGGYLYELNINSAGEVWVPVEDVGPVVRLDPNGNVLGSFPIPGCNGAVAFDPQNNAYLGVGCPGVIYEYAAGTYSSPTLFASGFSGTQSFRFNAAGKMFIADRATGIIYQATPGGTTASRHIVWASGLSAPFSIAIDPISQAVFVGDSAGKITRITGPGVFSTFATGLTTVTGLGFDTAGNLYAADHFVGAIWKFTRVVGTQIQPRAGGNAGPVSVMISGNLGFQSGATIKLTGSGPSVIGTNAALASPLALTTTFDLSGVSPGVRNLVITNPDNSVVTLPNAFTVMQGGSPQLWAQLVGLNLIRIGSPQTFYIGYGNLGSTDALGTRLIAYVPSALAPNLILGNSNGVVTMATQGSTTLIVINIGRVPASSASFIPVTLTAGASQAPFQVQIHISGH